MNVPGPLGYDDGYDVGFWYDPGKPGVPKYIFFNYNYNTYF